MLTEMVNLLSRNVIPNNMCSQRNGKVDDSRHCDEGNECVDSPMTHYCGGINVVDENHSSKLPTYQKGVLRTNCIDCLDRTNVAQYAYGMAALGQQLHALGVKDSAKIDLDDPLAEELMGFYERMGDTLAHQYGGSAAHNKVQFHATSNCLYLRKLVDC